MRVVYVISDGTGITAETFAKSLMAQFSVKFRFVKIPFVDSIEKAQQVIYQINLAKETEIEKPIVFTTLVNQGISDLIINNCQGLLLDMFGSFIQPLENELNLKSSHRIGRFPNIIESQEYLNRMEAINYTLIHDDGQTDRDLSSADVILIGVSRCGKTPTSLYLAMQFGLKVANYPLIPEDFERNQLPKALENQGKKIFGLTIDAVRLSNIRNERRPNSKYSSLENCYFEVDSAQKMMKRFGITWLCSTNKSIEELSATILQEIQKI